MTLGDQIRRLIRPGEDSLKLKSMRSAFWSLAGKGGSQFLRLVSSLILTRILFPEAFGLMATASVMLAMVQLFSDTGVRTSIIQNPAGDQPRFLDTAWIIAIGRGGLLCIVLIALALPMAKVYHDPKLTILLWIMALGPLIEGFENPAMALAVKHFRMEKQVVYEIGSKLLELVTTVALALALRSVYALAVGSVAAAGFRVAASYVIQPYRPRLAWDRDSGAELFRFGRFILLNTMLTWAALNADILIIGKLLDMDRLGFYQIGKNLGGLVAMFTVQIVGQAFLPAVSSVSGDRQRVVIMYRRTASFLVAVTLPLTLSLALFSNDIIGLLYDPRYQAAGLAMFWISIAGGVQIISQVTGTTFIATNRPVYETVSMGLGLAALLVLIPVMTSHWGMQGAAMAFLSAVTVTAIAESALAAAALKFSPGALVRPWAQAILAGAATAAVHGLIGDRFGGGPVMTIVAMGSVFLAGVAISGGVYVLFEGRRPFRDVRDH